MARQKTMIKKLLHLVAFASLVLCSSCTFKVMDVSYLSIHSLDHEPPIAPPKRATIAVNNIISPEGALDVVVTNLSGDIIIIDRKNSFLINTNGISQAFYDANIHSTTHTNTAATGGGIGVNVGAVANTLGASAAAAQALSGINIGSSSSSSQSVSESIYCIDEPQVSIGPKGALSMGRDFVIPVGVDVLKELSNQNQDRRDILNPNIPKEQSPIRFGIIITYSTDEGKTWEKLVSNYYVNSVMQTYVSQNSKMNQALRKIVGRKPNLMEENWYLLFFNIPTNDDIFRQEGSSQLYKSNKREIYHKSNLVNYK